MGQVCRARAGERRPWDLVFSACLDGSLRLTWVGSSCSTEKYCATSRGRGFVFKANKPNIRAVLEISFIFLYMLSDDEHT